MSQVRSSLNAIRSTRRSMAIGIWSLLVALMPLMTSGIPSQVAGALLFVASGLSAFGLLLIEWYPANPNRSRGLRYASIAISLLIPLSWLVVLSCQSAEITPIQVLIAIFPVMNAWLILASRTPLVDPSIKRSRAIEPPANKSTSPEPKIDQVSIPTTDCDQEKDECCEDEFENHEIGLAMVGATIHDENQVTSSNVTQWLTRSITDEGEIIQGGVRIDFSQGQRDATIHVSFCPPFGRVPEVSTEDLDGVGLEIRVSATYPFGTRLAVRRPLGTQLHSSESTYRVGFSAVAAPIRRAA